MWDPITGERRPAALPAIREALLDGEAGVDGVVAVAGPLLAMRDRVERGQVLAADEVLAAEARGLGPDEAPPACADLLRVQAQVWAAILDQDGAAPRDAVSAFHRDLSLGRVRDGLVPLRGHLLPEVAAHAACAGVIQRIVHYDTGRIVSIGTEERVFNRHQRRAIALRDGGCIIPGCGVPAGWCEVRRVVDHARGGPTHTDNGVLLCWFHHRFIDTGPWKVRMNKGVPEVQAPSWFDRTGRWRPVTTSRARMLRAVKRRT